MIILHHLADSRSSRIIWLLEEMKVPYKLKHYDRKSPALEDNGKTYIESAAVIEHLVRKYKRDLKPSEDNLDALEKYEFWMHYAEGSLMMLVVGLFVNNKAVDMSPLVSRFLVRKVTNTINENYYLKELFLNLEHVDDFLSTSKFVTGDHFTAADVQMSYPLLCLQSTVLKSRPYTNIKRWLIEVTSRPAFEVASHKAHDKVFQLLNETTQGKDEEIADFSSFSISA
ncbi:glutathione S-transferase Gst3 [Schizosaccharomyces cryophilus OY26]|uniref:Glutathione S-transferase Gst3 n=1 Tax=Schizosaccharomyces cryophilus (strain OY26 / ATCC MYA-4695 / CBS 11777 / NBRC 106824 / NRRL Y48691) TaxID=653667 RepID=S9XI87_SCHCR|nr:glutathione S-transferase Gst3 [Schizosaccharomyces cryophilus OY26]EPY53366.1 glutathione S-transferase Gst3 [Schizosaccharomyces cryophilus OY26]